MYEHDSNVDNIRKIKQIPPPEGVAREVIRVVANDQVDLTDVVGVINKCPAITARILRCANSAYFGQRAEISTVREAIIRVLGLKITCSLSLAMALTGSFNASRCSSFDTKRYWFTAITTAIIAQELSGYLKLRCKPEPATAYTAGLIHNIGIQALVYLFPEQMNRVFAQDKVPLAQALKKELGLDHHQTATILATSWDLPEELTQSLIGPEGTPCWDTDKPLPTLIQLSSTIADELFINGRCDMQSLNFDEKIISSENIGRVISETIGQIEGLQEIAQLITSSGA